ncbi:MAG: hypothetical protein FJ151_03245 [Euryarchaeota archaeon]|nr:hypothetical protein [Euryarchaeota archaeon]
MNADEVKIWNYGSYSDPNYGSSRVVRVGRLTLWFSGEQAVAFSAGPETRVSEDIWGRKAAKHLDLIDGGDIVSRIPYEKFMDGLEETLKGFELIAVDRPGEVCPTCTPAKGLRDLH